MLRSKLACGFALLTTTGVLLGALGAGCGAGGDSGAGAASSGTGHGASSGSATSNGGGSGSGTGTGGEISLFDGGHDDAAPDDGGCVGMPFKGEQLPLDIYVILDESGSMNEEVTPGMTRWKAVTDAIATFV